MSDAELNELGTFYEGDWKVEEIVGERRFWFARCARKGINPTLDELRKQMKEEPLMKEMFPNLHTALVIQARALRLLALRGWRTLCVRRRLPSVAWDHIIDITK